LYFLSRLAAKHVKVVLTGEGSDEMLAGYYRYRTTVYNLALGARYHRVMPARLRHLVGSRIESMSLSSPIRHKLTRTFLCLPPDIESLYFDNFGVFGRRLQQQLLMPETQDRIGSLDPYKTVRAYVSQTDADTLLNKLLYVDTKTYLHELLMKQDQMSMAASIESRVPFLDHKLVEFTAQLPQRMKLKGMTTKRVLREAMKGLLPEPILSRSKMGFPVPLGSWFRGPFRRWVDEYVLGDRSLSRGLFAPDFVRGLVARHQSGAENHAERLWMLLNFEIWQRQFIDGEALRTPEMDVSESVAVA
jgi:asparagine synthase (glutamine-hydrolysing)